MHTNVSYDHFQSPSAGDNTMLGSKRLGIIYVQAGEIDGRRN